MVRKKTSLLYDGAHYRVSIPQMMIRKKGWMKGDSLLLEENNGIITIVNTTSEKSMPVIYSIGYEGKSIGLFINFLQNEGIQQIIDIRERPFSFKSGFSKKPLKENLHDAGIGYHHMKELGTEKRSRDEYKQTGDIEKLCVTFAKRLEKSIEQYNILQSLVSYQTTALMCFEDDYRTCHRQVIEDKLEGDGFEIKHLASKCQM